MNYQKLLLCVIFLGLLPACFPKIDFEYYKINTFFMEASKDYSGMQKIQPDYKFNNDSVFLKLYFVTELVAFEKSYSFSNTALAMRKNYDGYKGLKDSLIKISFTSNQFFNDRAPGTNLIALLKYTIGYKNFDDDLLFLLNRGDYSRKSGISSEILHFTETPKEKLKHDFTMKLFFKSGRELSQNISLTWQ